MLSATLLYDDKTFGPPLGSRLIYVIEAAVVPGVLTSPFMTLASSSTSDNDVSDIFARYCWLVCVWRSDTKEKICKVEAL